MTNKHILGIAFGFTAGYVDTLGFVALFGLFTAHVTGNFVLIGSELVHPSHGVLLKFLAFPAFIFAVAVARVISIRFESKGRSPANALIVLQLLLLMAFMLSGLFSTFYERINQAPLILAGVAGAAAMGIQNAASRLVWTELAPTTVMTGNVTQIVIDVVDLLSGSTLPNIKTRLLKFLWPLVAFGIGAVSGAFTYQYIGFFALLLPMLILFFILVSFSK